MAESMSIETEYGCRFVLRGDERVVFETAHKLRLQPRDLHLAHASEQIEDFEEPANWGLNTVDYL